MRVARAGRDRRVAGGDDRRADARQDAGQCARRSAHSHSGVPSAPRARTPSRAAPRADRDSGAPPPNPDRMRGKIRKTRIGARRLLGEHRANQVAESRERSRAHIAIRVARSPARRRIHRLPSRFVSVPLLPSRPAHEHRAIQVARKSQRHSHASHCTRCRRDAHDSSISICEMSRAGADAAPGPGASPAPRLGSRAVRALLFRRAVRVT